MRSIAELIYLGGVVASVFVVLSDPCAKPPVAASAKAANNAAIVRNMGFSFVGR